MKTKLTLFLGICLFAFAGINAQTPVVSFETNKAVGESITLKLRSKTTGTISVDWGDGLLDAHEVTTNVNITLTKPLKGNTVKIYNDDLNNFECNSGGVTSADISRAVELVHVYLTTNSLTSLDVSANTNLQTLGIATNQITNIDLSNNQLLNNIYIQNNQFDACSLNEIYNALPIKPSGTFRVRNTNNPGVATSNTAIAAAKGWTVDVTGNATGCQPVVSFETNKVSGESITLKLRSKTAGTIDVDWGDGKLDFYSVASNAYIEVTEALVGNSIKVYNDNLNSFECKDGGITSLDVSKAVELIHIYLDNNSLTSLDVSANTNLQTLGVASNQFSSINLTNNIALNNVYIQNNQFDACELNKIYTDLPVKAEGTTYRINNTGNHGANTSNTNIATAKNWTVNVSGDGTGCFTSINSDIVNESATIISLKDNFISFNENNRGSIHIIDVSGKMIMQLDDIKGVDVSNLYSGLYLVKYNTNGTNGIIKVLMK
ncbi:MAG: T9SS type A sorting domain-containing protein [Paludibacter sp.]|nr:T9SS type A sorting domain-containing protein [Paludibacter sp.]